MNRFALAVAFMLLPVAAYAQHVGHGEGSMGDHHMQHADGAAYGQPTEAGQSAFAAIQEIVQLLENTPGTDWSKVDIEALRQHLIDMNNVTLHSKVVATPVKGGARYLVTGRGSVVDSIRRMVTAHATAMNGVDGWQFSAAEAGGGAVMTVTHPPDEAKIRGLGLIGIMTRGMHHQQHHLMIALGMGPHH